MTAHPIDPDWAWSPYEPTDQQPWDRAAAAHLYRRAGFGADWNQISDAIRRPPQEVVAELVQAREPESFRREMDALLQASLATGNPRRLSAQWVYRMLNTPAPLREKMTLFWHGHFATSAAKVNDAELMQQQNDLLRQFALGDFARLTLEVSRDPAMLLFLDSASNRKAHPNENYAREIMELFCLGEGNYSETDVRELARCFTGWEIKRKKFRFNRYQHDRGSKTVLGTTGTLSGEDGVSIVIDHPATPRFIASKLIRFFIMDEPTANTALVEPLARQLRGDGMQIGPTVGRILGSQLFFSTWARGRKIRSPVEFGIGFLRCLNGSTDAYQLADSLDALGQGLYYPPGVEGWDGGRTWINSSTLLARANLIERFLFGGKTRYGKQSIDQYIQDNGIATTTDLLDRFQAILFAVDVPQHARGQVIEGEWMDPQRRFASAIHLLCTLPEFQLA